MTIYSNASPRGVQMVQGSATTDLGAVMHSGVRACWVRSTGLTNYDPAWLGKSGKLFPTVAAAASFCRSGAGDVINVMPGHVENIATPDAWTNMSAGTVVNCWGYGSLRPTFTFTTATSSLLLNKNHVIINNAIFNCAGPTTVNTALTVVQPFTVSGENVQFRNTFFQVGVDNDQLCTKVLVGTDAADWLTFDGCEFYGATAAQCTTVLELLGSDHLRMFNTTIQAATSAVGVGVMRLNATALLDGIIEGCAFVNNLASSTAAVTGVAGSQGVVRRTMFGILGGAGQLVPWTTPASWQFDNQCCTVNAAGQTAAVRTVVST